MTSTTHEHTLNVALGEVLDRLRRSWTTRSEQTGHWLGKLKGLIWELGEQTGSFQAAIEALRRNLAVLDLAPYHSPSFGVPWQVVDGLASSCLMRAAVAELTKRAHAGEVLVIVTRGKRFWDIKDGPGMIVYTGGEARAASLSATSRGGKAILEFLGPSPSSR